MKKALFICCTLLFSLAHTNAWAKTKTWYIYSSENFEMYSDISKSKAEKELKEFERFREIIYSVTGLERKPDNSRLKIIRYSNSSDFRTLTGDNNTVGFYFTTSAGPRMLVGPSNGVSSENVLRHEYVHHILRQQGNYNYPRWYDEGFAELLAATKMTSSSIVLGAIPDYRAKDLRPMGDNGSLGKLNISELISPDPSRDSEQYRQRFYATAWLFMHYIQISPVHNKLPLQQQTADYNQRIGNGETPRKAFRESYGMTTKEMDGEIKKYFMLSRFPEIKLKFPQYTGSISQKKMSDSQAKFNLADIAYRVNEPKAALEYLQDINEADENASQAYALKAFLTNQKENSAEREKLINTALKIGQNDATTHTYIAQTYWDKYKTLKKSGEVSVVFEDKALELSRKATQIDPQSEEAYRLQASILIEKNLTADALKSLMSAYQINPTSVSLNNDIGEFLLAQKEHKLARNFFERLLLWAHSEKQRAYAKKRLDEIDNALVNG